MQPLPAMSSKSAVTSSDKLLRRVLVVPNQWGLHARPCALLVKTLRPFRCDVKVQTDGPVANGHSILSLLGLAAGFGTRLSFTATGIDAAQALAAVERLFESQFEEAYKTKTISTVAAASASSLKRGQRPQ